jgi:hypothetical protein
MEPCTENVSYPVARQVQHEQEGHDTNGHALASHITCSNQARLHPQEGQVRIFRESFSQGLEREEASWYQVYGQGSQEGLF